MRKFRDLLLAGTVVPALMAGQAGAAFAGPPMLLAQNAPGDDHRPHPPGAPGGNHGGEEGRPEAPRPQAQPQRAPEPQRAPQAQQHQEAPRPEAPRQEPPHQQPPRQEPPRQELQRAPEAPRPQVAPAPAQRAPEPAHQQLPAPQKRGGDEEGQPRPAPAPAQHAPEAARPQPAPAPQNRNPDGDRPPQAAPVQRRDAVPAAPQAAPGVPHAPAPATAAPPPAAAPVPANRAPGLPNNEARPLGQPLPTPPAGAGAPNGQRQGAPEADKRGNHPAGQPLPNPPPGGDNDNPAAHPVGAPNPGQPNNGPGHTPGQPGNAPGQPGNGPGQHAPGQPGNGPGQPNNGPGQPNNGPGQPGQPPQQQGRRGNNGGAAAIGAAAGFVGGFLAAQGLNNINQVQQQRQEYQDNGTTIYREPGRTIIEGPNDNYFVAHDENERFRDLGYDLRTDRRGDEEITVYRAPDGSEVTTITDVNGRLLRRVRRFPDGRDVVIIDNGPPGPPRPVEQDIVVLPPPPLPIPQDRYVVDADDADEGLIYDTLTAPPIAPITRRYTLDQVRYSPDLRARMRSVDLTAITFDTGSWTVAPEQAGKLATIARAINQAISRNPKAVFLVEGFTDATGNAVDNLSLSDRRAQSVATLLTQQFQVPPENLTTQGYGAQYLKVQTQGPEVRNRRVVVQNIAPLLDGGAK